MSVWPFHIFSTFSSNAERMWHSPAKRVRAGSAPASHESSMSKSLGLSFLKRYRQIQGTGSLRDWSQWNPWRRLLYVVPFIVITHGIGQMLQTLQCERAPASDATLKPRGKLQRHSACKLLNIQETLIVKTSYLRLYSTCHTRSPQPQKIVSFPQEGEASCSHTRRKQHQMLLAGQSQNWKISQHETAELQMSQERIGGQNSPGWPRGSPDLVDCEQLNRYI